MSAYAIDDRIQEAGKYPRHVEKFYCDEHGALLNDEGKCISINGRELPIWHTPDIMDVRRRMVPR